MSYSTAIQQVTATGALWFGKFVIVGRIPATCYDANRGGSKCFETEGEALAAVLADPWIQANPEQMIQGADCRVINRKGAA
jgi:hypothetical protein